MPFIHFNKIIGGRDFIPIAKKITKITVSVLVISFILVKSKPYLSPYFTNLGLQLVKNKQYNEAMFFLNVATFLNPKEYRILYSLGEVYYEKKLYYTTIAKLKAAIQINPKFIKGYLLLSRAYSQVKQYDPALNILQRAATIAPEDEEVARDLANIKKEYVVDQIAKAAEFYSKRDISQTKSTLKKAIELSDSAIYNLFVVETEKAQAKDIQEQINQLNMLSKVDPKRFSTHLLVANSLMENHDFKRAAEHYRKCLAQEPNNVTLHNNLAIALFKINQFDQAIKEFRIALSFDPDNKNIIYGLARSFMQTELLKEAENLYKYLLESSQDMPYVHIGLAKVHEHQNNFQAAYDELKKAASLSQEILSEDEENKIALLSLKKANEGLTRLVSGSDKNENKSEKKLD